jgi:hypothetical protein
VAARGARAASRARAADRRAEWNDDDFDVLADGIVVGRILKAAAAPIGTPWLWTLAFGHHEDRTPIYGYEPTREAAMAAFAKSWRRELKESPGRTGAFKESSHAI